jgi:hypothetical protein
MTTPPPEENSNGGESEDLTIYDFIRSLKQNDSLLIDLCKGSTIGENTVRALQSTTIGLGPWEYNILASATIANSILCNVLPIIQLIGEAGSGKSQVLIAISEISGQTLISGQSTGASLKNHINNIRWSDRQIFAREKRCLLLVDNLNEQTFDKEEYLASFLNGYNRRTDRTYISNGKGENIQFRTFCLKIYTTIWEPKSTELKRRTITIHTKRSSNLDKVLDIDDIDWASLRIACTFFWQMESNWVAFNDSRAALRKAIKPGLSKEIWTLLYDLLATGVCTGVWRTVDDAINQTFERMSKALKVRSNLLEAVILDALEKEIGFAPSDWLALDKTVRIYVQPKSVKLAIDLAVADGLIDKPKFIEVRSVLQKLNFTPGKKDGKLGYKFKSSDES